MRPGYGWSRRRGRRSTGRRFLADKDNEIARLSGVYVDQPAERRRRAGPRPRAVLEDAHTVEVDGERRRVTAEQDPDRHRRPAVPPDFPGIEHAITSNEAFHLREAAQADHDRGRRLYRAWSSPASSPAWASTPPWSIAAPTSCAASTTTCAPMCADEMEKRGIKVVCRRTVTRRSRRPTTGLRQLLQRPRAVARPTW